MFIYEQEKKVGKVNPTLFEYFVPAAEKLFRLLYLGDTKLDRVVFGRKSVNWIMLFIIGKI